MLRKRHYFQLLHELQSHDQKAGYFDPTTYYCAIPLHHTSDLEDVKLDMHLAQELFTGEYEFSFTKETSVISKRDLEGCYFNSDMNLLNDNFLHKFDTFQTKHPMLSKKLRAQTLEFVGFSNRRMSFLSM